MLASQTKKPNEKEEKLRATRFLVVLWRNSTDGKPSVFGSWYDNNSNNSSYNNSSETNQL